MSSNTNTSEPEWNYSDSDIAHRFIFFNVLKDGRIHNTCPPSKIVPPSFASSDSVLVKDVQISSDVSARIFLPSSAASSTSALTAQKLPVLFYIHGGGFCSQSAFTEDYTRFCSHITSEANIIVVSVEYGLFPARPIPACYDDCWVALHWVASHSDGSGPEPWINDHADLRRIFVGGDSAGGNICHTMLAKVGSVGLPGDAKVEGMIPIHPYFGEDDKMYMYMFPTNEGPQDPRMKPAKEDLARIGCDRVLVLLAEQDMLYGAGKMYAEELTKSGWKGTLGIMESKDKDHVFHLSDHTDAEAVAIRRRIASFIHNQDHYTTGPAHRQSISSNTNAPESEWNYSELDIAHKFLFFNVLKDGRIHILSPSLEKVPPTFGSSFEVLIKDVKLSTDVSARIFLPSSAFIGTCTPPKFPVLYYIHGGGFCMRSAFSEDYTLFGCQMASEATVIVVSVEYGLFPKRPLPACYDDSWAALQWVASHGNGFGPEPWINDYADLHRIFVGGNSAGGNICHTLLAKVGSIGLPGDAVVQGMILIHPYFGEDDKMWMYMCPTNQGPKDPRMKPSVEDLARIGCDKVLVLLAEIDALYSAGKMYAEELIKSGWKGTVQVWESKGKGHSFHLSNHMDLEAVALRQRITSLINHQC